MSGWTWTIQRTGDGCNQNVRTATLTTHPDLPLADADGHVHPASHHRRWPLFRHAADGLVADRRWLGAKRLRKNGRLYQFGVRAAHSVRLHLGADPPHARRHSPPDLGCRLWLWAR